MYTNFIINNNRKEKLMNSITGMKEVMKLFLACGCMLWNYDFHELNQFTHILNILIYIHIYLSIYLLIYWSIAIVVCSPSINDTFQTMYTPSILGLTCNIFKRRPWYTYLYTIFIHIQTYLVHILSGSYLYLCCERDFSSFKFWLKDKNI